MADPFAITTTSNTVLLDARRQAQTTFTLSNLSGRPLRVRARLVPQNPPAAQWLTLVGQAERDLPISGTQQFVVQIAAPPTAPAGSSSFRLDVVGVENPDELFAQGPTVTFTVPVPEVKKPFPIWIPIAAVVVVLLIVIAIVAFVILQNQSVVNLALNKTANQSSIAFGGDPAKAVDGNTSGDFFAQNSVTHTTFEQSPWWVVDLGSRHQIQRISIWNRTDCCSERLENYYVFVSDTPIGPNLTQTLTNTAILAIFQPGPGGTPTNLTINRSGRYIMVQLRDSGYLSLAEVQVWGH